MPVWNLTQVGPKYGLNVEIVFLLTYAEQQQAVVTGQTELLQFERGWALIYGVITPKRSGATSKCGANFLTMLARLTT
jgi:hypothetical protein